MRQRQYRFQSQTSLLMIRLAGPCHRVIERLKPGNAHPQTRQASGQIRMKSPWQNLQGRQEAQSTHVLEAKIQDRVDEQWRFPLKC